ncbi:cytochrome p450 [Moniliophthora roreri MCA 2997]|uniref:Cytochrome p450 n=1 Tax=Moniliophthora roreri (strain MCA 2997) TaxID=1381753 RepID=V2WJG3_MONRO|nr:cytochrome p450 [Moniliophthora roreri MCA 2997]
MGRCLLSGPSDMTFWVGTKGEEELDHIVGDQRASALHDLEKTLYIQAIFKETICIRPVGPVGIPHTTTSTEEFRGYVLPEGTAIFSDTYGIFHDPEHSTKLGMNDSAFQGHTASIVFSFGRIRFPLLSSLWFHLIVCWFFWNRESAQAYISHITLLFIDLQFSSFWPAKDPESGRDVPVDVLGYKESLTLTPKPFQCQIIPHGEHVKNIIESELCASTEIFIQFERDLAEEDKHWVDEIRSGW